MRKILIICMLLFFLSSCSFLQLQNGNNDNPKQNEQDKQEETNNGNSEEPKEPSEPGEPAEPSEPEDPSEPTDPVEPTGPIDPKDPSEPNEPEPVEEEQDIAKAYYKDLFDLNNKIYIDIDIDNGELQKIENSIQSDVYRLANKVTIKIVKPDETVIEASINQVGIKMKGNTSRRNFFEAGNIYQNVHFKLSFTETFDDPNEYKTEEMVKWASEEARDFRDDRTFFGLKKMELKWNREGDKTYSRDIYASQVYKQFGIYAQDTTLGVLNFTNQTFQNTDDSLGLYKVYEAVDKTFVKRYFGKSNKDGDLFKASYGSNVGMPSLNNVHKSGYGVDESIFHDQKKVTYALKTNKNSSDFTSIRSFLGYVNGRSDLEEKINDYMNEDYFITFLAIQYITGDWDNFLYDSNNYYLYFDNNNICYFIPYDMDRTFGVQAKDHDMANRTPLQMWNLQGDGNLSNLLKKTIYKSGSTLAPKYVEKIKEIASTILNEDNFRKVYDLIYQNYGEEFGIVYTDGGSDSPNNAIPSYFEKKLNAIG